MNTGSDLYIGLMSGTSLDAIDAVLVEFTDSGVNLVASQVIPLDPSIVARIRRAADGSTDDLNGIAGLDTDLGDAFADAALTLIDETGVSQVVAIGSHGQTVRHQPAGPSPYTVQLGSGARIAARTGVTTVTDFRSGDIALGGQGAPLVPAFHHAMFASHEEERAIVNIGGIANVTLMPRTSALAGFDTGPGNTLIDHWFRLHRSGEYDKNGAWAQTGNCLPQLLSQLLESDYFSQPPPKSTGLELFNLDWLRRYLGEGERPEDVQATLVQLTAESIAQALRTFAPATDAIYLCGGGAKNRWLVTQLESKLAPLRVQASDELGIPVDWVEAVAFAWLAKERLAGRPTNCPEATGSSRKLALGAVYLG